MKLIICSLILACLLVLPSRSSADTITSTSTVPNFSFELPSSPTQTSSNVNVASGWVFNVKGGSAYGTAAIGSNFASKGTSAGTDYAFINNDDPNVTDTITSAASLGTITPDTTYQLTVAIGNRNGTGLYAETGNVSLSLLANGVSFASKTVANGAVANGTFQDFTLSFTSPDSGSIIGEDLKLQLASLPETANAFQPGFDNVRLQETAVIQAPQDIQVVPEPNPAALLVSGMLVLVCLLRRRHLSHRVAALPLLLVGLGLSASQSAKAEAIKSLPLDDQTVYHLKVGSDKITTLSFPQPITALEGSGLSSDPKTPARMLLSYHAGDRFFSVRALSDEADADLNVIINRKVYVLELTGDKDPVQSVTFYPADEPPAETAGRPVMGPNRLFALLDKAKAYPLLAGQYPEMVSQIDQAEPFTQTLYEGFHVILSKVFRFDPEDALIFQVEFVNETDHPIIYVPQSLAVRVGSVVYWSALSDASGVIPAGSKDPKTGAITEGHSHGYFVICGTAHGGRNHLAAQNKFNVLVFRQENNS